MDHILTQMMACGIVLSVGDQSYPFVLYYFALSKNFLIDALVWLRKDEFFQSIHWNLKTGQLFTYPWKLRVLKVELMHFTFYCLNLNIRFGARWKDSADNEY